MKRFKVRSGLTHCQSRMSVWFLWVFPVAELGFECLFQKLSTQALTHSDWWRLTAATFDVRHDSYQVNIFADGSGYRTALSVDALQIASLVTVHLRLLPRRVQHLFFAPFSFPDV